MSTALAFDPEDVCVEVRTRFRSDGGRLDRIELRWRCE
jgi:hypothetical protein